MKPRERLQAELNAGRYLVAPLDLGDYALAARVALTRRLAQDARRDLRAVSRDFLEATIEAVDAPEGHTVRAAKAKLNAAQAKYDRVEAILTKHEEAGRKGRASLQALIFEEEEIVAEANRLALDAAHEGKDAPTLVHDLAAMILRTRGVPCYVCAGGKLSSECTECMSSWPPEARRRPGRRYLAEWSLDHLVSLLEGHLRQWPRVRLEATVFAVAPLGALTEEWTEGAFGFGVRRNKGVRSVSVYRDELGREYEGDVVIYAAGSRPDLAAHPAFRDDDDDHEWFLAKVEALTAFSLDVLAKFELPSPREPRFVWQDGQGRIVAGPTLPAEWPFDQRDPLWEPPAPECEDERETRPALERNARERQRKRDLAAREAYVAIGPQSLLSRAVATRWVDQNAERWQAKYIEARRNGFPESARGPWWWEVAYVCDFLALTRSIAIARREAGQEPIRYWSRMGALIQEWQDALIRNPALLPELDRRAKVSWATSNRNTGLAAARERFADVLVAEAKRRAEINPRLSAVAMAKALLKKPPADLAPCDEPDAAARATEWSEEALVRMLRRRVADWKPQD